MTSTTRAMENPRYEQSIFSKAYKSIQLELMSSKNSEVFRIESSEDGDRPKSFVGFVQVFSEQIETTLKSPRLVAYPVRVILVNISLSHRRWDLRYLVFSL